MLEQEELVEPGLQKVLGGGVGPQKSHLLYPESYIKKKEKRERAISGLSFTGDP